MGKKGDELRARKAQTVYSFTREQLERRDKTIVENYKRQYHDIMVRELERERQKIYSEAEKIWADERHNLFFIAMQYYCSMCCEVLIEHFKFIPTNKKNGRLLRFVNAITNKVSELSESGINIDEYRNDVFQKYGIKFNWGDENAED